MADWLLGRYEPGSVASLSFDKGFMWTQDRELLSLYVPVVVMPQQDKKNAAETAAKAKNYLEHRLNQLKSSPSQIQSPTGFDWIVNVILNA